MSLLYHQVRVGKNGELFTMHKIRTFPNGADANGVSHPATNGDGATWWGKILRRFAIDELPQLWNVLKGEMALVGPRPEVLKVLETFYPENWRRRVEVKPGLAGLAQLKGARDPYEKMKYDLDYIAYKETGAFDWRDDARIVFGCLCKAVKGRW